MRKLALLIVLVAAACGGDDSPAADAPQALPDGPPVMPDGDPNACASPGAVGNEMGVGEYCTEGNGECSDNTGAFFCTADVGETPSFCTKPCSTTAQCGADATCRGEVDGGQMGCVPNCLM